MTYQEFSQKYANLPLEKRSELLDAVNYGTFSVNDAYNEIKRLDDLMRPLRIE